MTRFLLGIFALLVCFTAHAQTQETPPNKPVLPLDKQQVALQSLATEITKTTGKLDKLETDLAKLKNEDERAAKNEDITAEQARLDQLRTEFISVAANVDLAAVDDTLDVPLSLSGEITELMRPLMEELKDATSGPRDMETLNNKIREARERQKTNSTIVAALEQRKKTSQNQSVLTVIDERLERWKEKEKDSELNLEVLEFQRDDLQKRSVPIVESLSNMVESFFRSRGLHLLIALLVFGVILFVTKKGRRLLQKISPLHRAKGRSLSTRIVDLIFLISGFILALLGAILVLYLANDWLLLTLALLFAVGTLWVSKEAFPKVIEQVKLMLNLGAVREGERVIYEGLPWEVKNINVYTDLVNPALKGGVRRLPIKDLLELRSRVSESEDWFPCTNGEWVVLSDETFGRVIEQTPEFVEIIRLGGARKFYPTGSFLDMAPTNLSRNFRINSIFGIDYQHQGISTSEVPLIFETRLNQELIEMLGNNLVKNVSVQFKSAGASSLDYEVLADFTGEAASKYSQLHRIIQRVCVDVCNEQDWGIPFTQITVHQAPSE